MIGGEEAGNVPSMPGIGDFAPLLGKALAALTIGGALFTLVSGVVTFILFLGLGQACYALLDVEEQQHQMNDTLGIILARLANR